MSYRSSGDDAFTAGAFRTYGVETPFNPGSYDQNIEDGLTAFNSHRLDRGERPVYYVKQGDGARRFQMGDFPPGYVPRVDPVVRAGVDAEKMNNRQAATWPKS